VLEKGYTYYEMYMLLIAITYICKKIASTIDGLEYFHFHLLRHSYTSNLLAGGASLKEAYKLLGYSDVSTIMNIYAHATRQAKRDCARLLDRMESEA